MKIYTKTGDNGTSGILGGERIDKDNEIFELLGNVDELNAFLGILFSSFDSDLDIQKKIIRIQEELLVVGADIATPINTDINFKKIRIDSNHILKLELEIDTWDKDLPQLKNFILPTGELNASFAFSARAICRRAERSFYRTLKQRKLNKEVGKYLNRLSDWLFVLARVINLKQNVSEKVWIN